MTDLRDRVLAAIEDADEPLTVLQLAGTFNSTIWQINRCVNTLELAGDIVVDHRHHGINRVATADDGLVADGGKPVSDPEDRVYCPACKLWNGHDNGDCSICGETIAEAEAEETRVGHCKHDATDVYAGRGKGGRDMLSVAEPGQRGWLGNPFALDDHSRAESIRAFRQAFEDKLQRDAEFRDAVADLAGKTLGCWCQHVSDSEPGCHAEVIAEWADKLAREGDAALDDAERIVTDGGRQPLRRCSKCGLIHRPTGACRAVNGGGDR